MAVLTMMNRRGEEEREMEEGNGWHGPVSPEAERGGGGEEEEETVDEVICAVEFGECSPLTATATGGAVHSSSSSSSGSSSSGGGGSSSILPRDNTNKVTSIGVCIFERASFKLRFCQLYTTSDISLLEALLLQVRPAIVVSSEGGSRSCGGGLSRGSTTTTTSAAAAAASCAATTKGWEKKLQDVAEGTAGSVYIQLPRAARDTRGLLQDLENLLRPGDELKNHIATEIQLKTACAACASLLYYTRLLSDDAYVKQCSLDTYPTDLYLQVDAAAAAALYLFPSLALQRRQQQQLAATGTLLLNSLGRTDGKSDKDAAPAGAYIKRTSAAAAAASSSGSPGVSSVYALLARWTGTALGARRLFAVLSQPLVDRQEIERRLDVVEIFHTEDAFRRIVFSSHFKHVYDLDALAAKLHRVAAASRLGEEDNRDGQQQHDGDGDTATSNKTNSSSSHISSKRSALIARARIGLESLVRLYNCILEASSLKTTLLEYKGLHAKTLQEDYGEPLAAAVDAFKPYLELIDFTIDADEASRGCFVVKKEFDSHLAALLQERTAVQRRIQSERQRVEQDLPLDNRKRDADAVRLSEDATMGFVLRVTKKDQAAVFSYQHQGERGIGGSNRSRVQILRVNKSEVLFTTAELKQHCGHYKELCEAVEVAQKSVVEKVLCVAASYWPVVERLAELLGMLDVLGAFAAAANAAPIPYVRPRFLDEAAAGTRIAFLENCRHPLVEQQAGSSAFISNDVLFDREEARVHVVTGPNMGGKSTYIRQAALAVVLAQSGCFVPCSRCELVVFKRVLCRVGASDMQLRGVSTFLAEMLEASSVLRHAQRDSLVIVDEIGRGTSTYEGFGLAWAIAKELAENTGCCCLFATHFHEMGLLASEVKGVINSHVAAAFNPSSKELTFLYRVEKGAADQSYGVLVAQYAGLPAAVVRRAASKARELEAIERGGSDSRGVGSSRTRSIEDADGISNSTGSTNISEMSHTQAPANIEATASATNAVEAEQGGDATVADNNDKRETHKNNDSPPHTDDGVSGLAVNNNGSKRRILNDTDDKKMESESEMRNKTEEDDRAMKKRKQVTESFSSDIRGSRETTPSPHDSSIESKSKRGGGGSPSSKRRSTDTNINANRSTDSNNVQATDDGPVTTEKTNGFGTGTEEGSTKNSSTSSAVCKGVETTNVERFHSQEAWQQLRHLLREAFAVADAETFAEKVKSNSGALSVLRKKLVPPDLHMGSGCSVIQV